MKIKAMYSDPHYYHANIIKYCNRPFNDKYHMNKILIDNYNKVINHNDNVIWLGDCFFKNMAEAAEVMRNLNGSKILVIGNHDKSPAIMTEIGFSLVMDECFMRIADRDCRLNHYPYINGEPLDCRKDDRYKHLRPPKVKHQILIHGHTHSKKRIHNNMVHVGCDAWNYSPAPYKEIESIVASI